MKIETLDRVSLALLPTPVHEMPRLASTLGGPRLFVKRDDQTGLAFGGNKTRKLEYLMADALRQGADTVITVGAAQSNHCRQTAAAAAACGLDCVLVLNGEPPEVPEGNLVLDLLFRARILWTEREKRDAAMEECAERLRAGGKHPYLIPCGGSNAVGAAGYAAAMGELVEQARAAGLKIDHLVFASSSGGTQAGLVVGARAFGFTGTITGISIDKGERGEEPYEVELAALANDTAERIGLDARFSPEDFHVVYDYLGDGYGVVGELERRAVHLAAEREGILLDPVYTGRAMGGLMDMIQRKVYTAGETVLFWHTGGTPALFAYVEDLGLASP